jgi:polyisoprenoid-binding protein YceI
MGGMDAKQDQTMTTPRLGRYEIDTGRSTIAFRSRHLFGLAPVRGTFAVRAGIVDIGEPLTDSRVRAEIETASFHTGHGRRDTDVRSARFLDAAHHPVMTFVSTGLDGTTLSGTLTVGDVARPVSLAIEWCDVSPEAFTARATTRIDRTAFGVTAARGLAGRHLDLILRISCRHR